MTLNLLESVPFGLKGSQVNYVISKLELQGQCEYMSGILYVPETVADSISDMMNDYPHFKALVDAWEANGGRDPVAA